MLATSDVGAEIEEVMRVRETTGPQIIYYPIVSCEAMRTCDATRRRSYPRVIFHDAVDDNNRDPRFRRMNDGCSVEVCFLLHGGKSRIPAAANIHISHLIIHNK